MVNCVAIIWPNEVHLQVRGYRNTNLLTVLYALCNNEDIGIAGNASSGKTYSMAAWAIVDWLCAPDCTSTFVASTSLEASADRIWGKIESLFKASARNIAGRYGPHAKMGHLIAYRKMIAYETPDNDKEKDYANAIKALAFPEGNEGIKAVETTRGRKNQRVRLLVDELAEMDIYVLNARVNLKANPDFFFCGAANPSNKGSNPHKELCQPNLPGDWDAINMTMRSWPTRTGICIFISGEDSPNFLAPETEEPPFEYYLTREREQDILNTVCYGNKNSIEYWRNVYGFWPNSEVELTVLTKSFIMGANISYEPRWYGQQQYLGAFDPAFTSGGDRCAFSLGKMGYEEIVNSTTNTVSRGRRVLHYLGATEFQAEVGVDFETSIARQVVKKCIDAGIDPECFGLDISSDGGKMLKAIIIEWQKVNNKAAFIMAISSLGSPSEKVVSAQDSRTCKEAYDRLVTEYWFDMRNAIGSRVFVGLDMTMHRALIDELCSRLFVYKGKRVSIETKKEMKARIKKSPDCFVEGTLVKTQKGDVKIENLCLGDKVVTPFGVSPIIAIQEDYVLETHIAKFTTGRSLQGKGKHKIFTWDSGWVRMDNLQYTNSIESDTDLYIWKFLNLFFTKDTRTTFKALVDIIRMEIGGRISLIDFYTELSGLRLLAKYLKDLKSTIKTEIGQIIDWIIWRFSPKESIARCICEKSFSTQNFEFETQSVLKKQFSKPLNGTAHQKEGLGIKKMGKIHSKTELKTLKYVLNAERNSKRSQEKHVAVPATNLSLEKNTVKTWIAQYVVKVLTYLSFPARKHAPVSVEAFHHRSPKRVLNITLLDHNVYYANGVLVQNCADSAIYLLVIAMHKGLELITEQESDKISEDVKDFEEKHVRQRSGLGVLFSENDSESEAELYSYSGASKDLDGF